MYRLWKAKDADQPEWQCLIWADSIEEAAQYARAARRIEAALAQILVESVAISYRKLLFTLADIYLVEDGIFSDIPEPPHGVLDPVQFAELYYEAGLGLPGEEACAVCGRYPFGIVKYRRCPVCKHCWDCGCTCVSPFQEEGDTQHHAEPVEGHDR